MDISNYKYMDSLFLDSYKMMDQMQLYTDRPLEVVEAVDAVVLPYKEKERRKLAGVMDADGNFITLSGFSALSEVDSWGGAYEAESAEYLEETVIYFGRFWKHWGHFLMDMVSRMWYILSNPSDYRIVYDSSVDISGVYLEFLKLIGISEERLLRIDRPTGFQKVIIPECSHKPGIAFHKEYKLIFDTAIENALREIPSRKKYQGKSLYFTRRMQKSLIPMEVGEKEIEQIFRKNGFLVIAPERHSLAEQIAMIYLADRIACVSGTLPHNMVFAHDGEELVIIRKTNKPNYRQVAVNQMRDLKVCSIDAHISLAPVGPSGPFVIDFNQNMQEYCKNYGMTTSYNAFLQWFRRKLKVIWYLPLLWKRNHGKDYQVPIFDGEKFTTNDRAKKELRRFYSRRV